MFFFPFPFFVDKACKKLYFNNPMWPGECFSYVCYQVSHFHVVVSFILEKELKFHKKKFVTFFQHRITFLTYISHYTSEWHIKFLHFTSWYYLWTLSGEAHALEVENILFKGKSEYQEVMVFEVRQLEPLFFLFKLFGWSLDQYLICLYLLSTVCIIRESPCTWWHCSTDRERWMCLPRNDSTSSSLFNPISKIR